jgi:nitrilase
MVNYPAYRVACAHVAPVFLDTTRTVEKACDLIAEAARGGARLIAFPEGFVPGFPFWAALAPPIRNHEFFKRLAEQALAIDGSEVARLRECARRNGIFVSIGITEGTTISVGCLWNTNLLIGEDGAILNHHRKLVPTFYEKLIWAPGDGAGLRVVETPIGRIGALICGENTNPLARYSLMAQGEQVHVSSWPPIWPTRPPGEKGYDLELAIRIRAGAHAFEAKVFNLVASSFLDRAQIEAMASIPGASDIMERTPRAVSMVIGPGGDPVSETLQASEGLLYADIDLADAVETKQFHDVVGYYNRFDVFQLNVNRAATRPITFTGDEVARAPAPPLDSPPGAGSGGGA